MKWLLIPLAVAFLAVPQAACIREEAAPAARQEAGVLPQCNLTLDIEGMT